MDMESDFGGEIYMLESKSYYGKGGRKSRPERCSRVLSSAALSFMLARLGVCLREKLSPTIPATAAKSAVDRYNKFALCV